MSSTRQRPNAVSPEGNRTAPAMNGVPSYDAVKKAEGFWTDIKEDLSSIILLLFLYTLQGVPIGLAASVPLVLQEKNIGFKQQAIFSLVAWPFSLKLLWAPIVDSFYSSRFGRRKSWLVPIQLLIGIVMLFLGATSEKLLDAKPEPDVWSLTYLFGFLYLLTATQDIAVDGWALTMLSRKNIGYASTCNTIGQTVGYLVAYVIFLAFNSPDFCNMLRSEPSDAGMVSLSGFMHFWGWIFIVSTVYVWIFKNEHDAHSEDEPDIGIVKAYVQMWQLCKLRPMLWLALLLLTAKIGFSAADAVTTLKLVQKGISKESMGMLAVAITPINIIMTALVAKWTSGPKPLTIFMHAYFPRLLMGLVFAAIVYFAPTSHEETHWVFFLVVIAATLIHQLAMNLMFVVQMSFFARISDPSMGGTAMTLLNTLANLGSKWTSTIILWLVDSFTYKSCVMPGDVVGESCDDELALQTCTEGGGTCTVTTDGFYTLSVACVVIGVIWWIAMVRKIKQLEVLPESDWWVKEKGTKGRMG